MVSILYLLAFILTFGAAIAGLVMLFNKAKRSLGWKLLLGGGIAFYLLLWDLGRALTNM